MTRFYTHYKNWEDWAHGLYVPKIDKTKIDLSAQILSDQSLFLDVAMKMINEWGVASAVNLSNKSQNRQAWIGQASCCYAVGATANTTIQAWRLLQPETQTEANQTADAVINYYERIKGIDPCQNVLWA